jgi:anaerobic ribonucleoside-triphosphate reductase activating protein
MDIFWLVQMIRSDFGYTKTIWLYTGFTIEEIYDYDVDVIDLRKDIISMCDVLVDGPYIHEQRDITLPFKGSKNQRLIDIKKTLTSTGELGEIVE